MQPPLRERLIKRGEKRALCDFPARLCPPPASQRGVCVCVGGGWGAVCPHILPFTPARLDVRPHRCRPSPPSGPRFHFNPRRWDAAPRVGAPCPPHPPPAALSAEAPRNAEGIRGSERRCGRAQTAGALRGRPAPPLPANFTPAEGLRSALRGAAPAAADRGY